MEVFNNARQSANMVAVRMRERNDVKVVQASRPKIRRDHIFAKIEFTAHRTNAAATINEHGSSLGRNYEQGISLSDVDGRDFQLAALNVRRGMVNRDNCAREK